MSSDDLSNTSDQDQDCNATEMACDILSFLDASPHSLLTLDTGSTEAEGADQDVFQAFMSLVLCANSKVRTLATSVAGRLFKDPHIVQSLRSRGVLASSTLRVNFWKHRYVPAMSQHGSHLLLTRSSCRLLVALCDKVLSEGGLAAVRDIHDYLVARVMLTSCVKVGLAAHLKILGHF